MDVINNQIPSNAKNGDSFYVTFVAKGIPSVWVKAKFTITISDPPTITVNGPLEVAATETSANLSKNQLMNGVTATDDISGNITGSVNVIDGSGALPMIDTSKESRRR